MNTKQNKINNKKKQKQKNTKKTTRINAKDDTEVALRISQLITFYVYCCFYVYF